MNIFFQSGAVAPAQKRKLATVDKDDDVPAEKIPGTSSFAPTEPKERKLLRAKRCAEPPKTLETPQMKEMRQKILDKKRLKPAQNAKIKSDGDNANKAASVSSKSSRGTRRGSKKSEESSCSGSQSSALTLSRGSSTVTSAASKRSLASKSSTASRNAPLKKNLANKRLDSLKNTLKAERKKIEPTISDTVTRRMLSQIPSDAGNGGLTPKSPTSPSGRHRSIDLVWFFNEFCIYFHIFRRIVNLLREKRSEKQVARGKVVPV